MQPTPDTINHLVILEAHYHYSPGDDCLSREALMCQPGVDPIGTAWVNLILHFEDQADYDSCARIVRAILDTYAPRRSVLDFDGVSEEVESRR